MSNAAEALLDIIAPATARRSVTRVEDLGRTELDESGIDIRLARAFWGRQVCTFKG